VVAKLSNVPESSPTPTIASSSAASSTGIPGQGEGVRHGYSLQQSLWTRSFAPLRVA
jgi:hypothetical protein